MSKREKVMRASRNERTGKVASKLAGKWLALCRELIAIGWTEVRIPVTELATLCASNLTQSPDRGIVLATATKKKVKK